MIKALAILIGLLLASILLVRSYYKVEDIEFNQEEIDVSLGIEDPFINKK